MGGRSDQRRYEGSSPVYQSIIETCRSIIIRVRDYEVSYREIILVCSIVRLHFGSKKTSKI